MYRYIPIPIPMYFIMNSSFLFRGSRALGSFDILSPFATVVVYYNTSLAPLRDKNIIN